MPDLHRLRLDDGVLVMGEAKRRAVATGHRPPEGMVNASGPLITAFSKDIHDRVVAAADGHIGFDIALNLTLAVVIDLLRVNTSDAEAARVISTTTRQRLSKPLEYWGVERNESAARR